jgi:hypothetical protein
MTNELIKKAIALTVAATTTLVLFSSVVSIAKEDKMALAMSKARTTVASVDVAGTAR